MASLMYILCLPLVAFEYAVYKIFFYAAVFYYFLCNIKIVYICW